VLDGEVGGILGVAKIFFAPFGLLRRCRAFGLRLARLIRPFATRPAAAASSTRSGARLACLRGRRSLAFLRPLATFSRSLPRLARVAGLLAARLLAARLLAARLLAARLGIARLFITAGLFAGGLAPLLLAWLLLTTLSITALLAVARLLASRLPIASLSAALLASLLLALAAALLILALRTIATFLTGGLLLARSWLI
jgi:hypothetical protein